MKARCIIVDDEPLSIEVIESYIKKTDRLELKAKFTCAVEAFEYLQSNETDLIFLDIQMPELTGINFLKILKNAPKVIFVTAYREYALEGFELDIIDYLLKPVSFERFLKALDKYFRSANLISQSNEQLRINNTDEVINLKIKHKVHRIKIDNIIYIESIKDYIRIYYSGTKTQLIKYTLGDLEKLLKNKGFIRIHRSFIISKKMVTSYSPTSVELNEIELPIGRSYKAVVQTEFEK